MTSLTNTGLHLALTYGGARAKLVDGTTDLFKVTHKQDLFAAEQMFRLQRCKVALVTGAGRGIGKEVARLLSQRGVAVYMVARSPDELKQAALEVKGTPIVADMSVPEEVELVFRQIAETHGRLDLCINCAGIALKKPIAETSNADWAKMIDGNLSSTFYCCRQALQVMTSAGGGVIVNVGSSSVSGGRAGQAAYSSSKVRPTLTLTLTLTLKWDSRAG
jgi:NAD(P)-dependent dehydrogenase (short-subunit alcohol dehydrogenase family)